MIKQSLPAVSLVTADNFETFIKSDKIVIVGFFDATDVASNQTFTALAQSQRDDFVFGATNDASLAEQESLKRPGVIMCKTYDDPKTVHEGPFEEKSLSEWTKVNSMPIFGEIGPTTFATYMDSGIPLAYLFVQNEEQKAQLTGDLKPTVRKYRGKINFGTIDAVQYGSHAGTLNLYVAYAYRTDHIAMKRSLRSSSMILQRMRNIHLINLRRSMLTTSRNSSTVTSMAV